MSLSTRTPLSRVHKTALLGVLYFIQGLPYGFQDKLIPLLLIVRHGASTVALTRLLLLPWLLKPLLAPIIEMTSTKAKWVTASLLSLAAISLLNALAVPESSDATSISSQLSCTLFVLNLFSAIQDIAVDAIAIAVLHNGNEVASGNAAQIVGYKFGAFFGSGVLFWIYSSFNWTGLFFAFFVLYTSVLIIFQFTLSPRLKETDKKWHTLSQLLSQFSPLSAGSRLKEGVHSMPSFFGSIGISSLGCYLLLYKLGEAAASTTFPFFLINAGVSSHQIAFWNGTVAMTCSILGSTLASKLPVSRLPLMIKLRLLPLFVQLLLVALSEVLHFDSHPLLFYCSVVSLVLLHFIGGLITTHTFSLMMLNCQSMPESFRTTHYTLLSSLEVFGKLMFASLSGFCVDLLGFSGAQLVYLVMSFCPLYFLKRVVLLQEEAKKCN